MMNKICCSSILPSLDINAATFENGLQYFIQIRLNLTVILELQNSTFRCPSLSLGPTFLILQVQPFCNLQQLYKLLNFNRQNIKSLNLSEMNKNINKTRRFWLNDVMLNSSLSVADSIKVFLLVLKFCTSRLSRKKQLSN